MTDHTHGPNAPESRTRDPFNELLGLSDAPGGGRNVVLDEPTSRLLDATAALDAAVEELRDMAAALEVLSRALDADDPARRLAVSIASRGRDTANDLADTRDEIAAARRRAEEAAR